MVDVAKVTGTGKAASMNNSKNDNHNDNSS